MKTDHDTPAFRAIVLAAGKGTRMRSRLPKMLHPVAGRPMVAWPVHAALAAGAVDCAVVVGHGGADVEDVLTNRFGGRARTVIQPDQRGTGDAVRCALEAIEPDDLPLIVLNGDCPLVEAPTLEALARCIASDDVSVAMLTASTKAPTGYGRIVRDPDGRVRAIREHSDCSAEELRIEEINPGVYAFVPAFLRASIGALTGSNAQGEFYLTDMIELASAERGVATLDADLEDLRGVNDRYELALCEDRLRRRVLERLARAGVTIRDLATTFIDPDAVVESEVVIETGVAIRGACHIAAGARIDVGCVLERVRVEAGAYVRPYTVATESTVGARATVGPFAHLRPGSTLGPETRVGNFVETKNAHLGRGSKAGHLSYLGDATIGERVNLGAGTIVCNYDGARKHPTHIEDDVFVGSDSQLVAPVRLGRGAYVATGTTVTDDVPPDALAIGRVRQQNKAGYATNLRKRLNRKPENQE